jgi:hypothetical protein
VNCQGNLPLTLYIRCYLLPVSNYELPKSIGIPDARNQQMSLVRLHSCVPRPHAHHGRGGRGHGHLLWDQCTPSLRHYRTLGSARQGDRGTSLENQSVSLQAFT